MSQEREEILREGNTRGVFGYSKQFYNLSRRYRINVEKINYIVNKYRTMKNFMTSYRLGKLDEEDYTILNIRRYIDIRLSDNIGFDMLMRDIIVTNAKSSKDIELMPKSKGFIIYDSDMLRDIINEEIRKRYSDIVRDKYGLDDGVYKSDTYIKEKIGTGVQAVWNIKNTVLTQLKERKLGKICPYNLTDTDDEAKIQKEMLEKEFLSSDYIFYPDSEYKSENPNNKHEEELSKFIKYWDERKEEQRIKGQNTSIGYLNLSTRSYNALNDAGIKTIEDLKQIYLNGGLRMILGLGKKSQEEIIRVLKERNIIQDGEQDEEKPELEQLKEQREGVERERKALKGTVEKAREFVESYDIYHGEDIDTD